MLTICLTTLATVWCHGPELSRFSSAAASMEAGATASVTRPRKQNLSSVATGAERSSAGGAVVAAAAVTINAVWMLRLPSCISDSAFKAPAQHATCMVVERAASHATGKGFSRGIEDHVDSRALFLV